MNGHFMRGMAIVTVLIGTVTYSIAGGGTFTRGCAARDMQIMMMLEQRESTNGIATHELTETLNTIVDARMICSQGRVVDALEIYDNIARRIASDFMLSGRIK
jgi:hypothetical protein